MTWATPFGSEVAQVRSPGSLHNRWCCDPELKPPTPNGGATQNRGDVAHANPSLAGEGLLCSPGTREACVSFRVKGHCASERFEHCVDDSQMLGRSLSAPA
ncbi:hypothetical protein BRL93_02040 [Xanthomonas oryzae pv. oryzae]|nr:hypothetical protein BRL93_02040 [Xanthomonas oryzae pv. oryzae]